VGSPWLVWKPPSLLMCSGFAKWDTNFSHLT
jgi:hypothetical protein